jgi:mevalonate kinase
MQQRLTANTATLQKQFPTIYRDFFAHCQRVASASNSFLWTGEFSGFYEGLTVSQKLPIRSYVGFETTFDGSVTIKREYHAFDAERQQFTIGTADDRLCSNLQHYLEEYYANDKEFSGIRVHMLTEVPLGHSLGSNGAITAALALLLTGEGDREKTFQIARTILAQSQAGHSSGVTAYMALSEANSPVVFTSDATGYYAKLIEELADLKELPIWPIDFGLIYSGVQTNAESVIMANDQTVAELEADTQRLRALLDGKRSLNFRQTYIDMLTMTASLTVLSFVELFSKGSKNTFLEQLFNSLNQYQNLLHILHASSPATDLIYSRIHQLANKQRNDVGSGVKISGIGKGGAVLFALPYGMHREALVTLVDELRQETGRPLWIDYASWIDGIGGDPGRIDQDIVAGTISSFLDSDTCRVTILDKGVLRMEVVTRERFSLISSQMDLLLDKTTGKIMIRGQATTSKELVSQKSTVSIISDLIAAPDFSLRNDQLPASYGTSRYDLQGKIVIPLVRLVKQLTERDLQLTIEGGMYDDYTLHLDPGTVVIGVVQDKS